MLELTSLLMNRQKDLGFDELPHTVFLPFVAPLLL